MARHPKSSTPKLTPELIESLAQTIRGGCYVETAVALAGISKQTFYRWCRAAHEDDADELLKKLSDSVRQAQAQAEYNSLQIIQNAAAQGDWRAAQWRLERMHRDRYGQQTKVQVEQLNGEVPPRDVNETRETLKRILTDPEALLALQTLEDKLETKNQDTDDDL